MRADLAALVPPLVVCAAFMVGLVVFLRHQLAPKRRADDKRGSDEPANPGNPGNPAKSAKPANHTERSRDADP